MTPDPADRDRSMPWLPLSRRSSSIDRVVSERTWMLEQQVEQLKRERQDLRRILRGLGEGVLAVDRAGLVVHANPTAVALLDLVDDAGIGSHMYVAVPNADVCDLLEDVMRGEGRISRELVIERPEGDTVLTVTVRSLRKAGREDGEAEGAIAVVRDVTELRRLERLRQEFFGNVSHELKTPVTAIRGSIDTILDDPDMSHEDRTRFLSAARRHSVRLGALVTDLLALARLEAGEQALVQGDVDLTALAEEVLIEREHDAARAGVTLRLELDEAAPGAHHLRGDREALRRAVGNLVDNAIAHSDSGRDVVVRLRRDRGELELCVIDSGEGVPPELIERVFERFFRIDTDRSREKGGSGIGLSIVKHVAQAHGGVASASSVPGEGSSFCLRLPVSPSARTETHTSR